MGGKQSTTRTRGSVVTSNGATGGNIGGPSTSRQSGAGGGVDIVSSRGRTRSLGSVQNGAHGNVLNIPSSNGGAVGANVSSPDSDDSTPEDGPFVSRGLASLNMQPSSLPLHLFSWHAGIKCPVCSKLVQPDDIECHLVMCLTKPRISYNEDVLTEDKGECVICLEDLQLGDTIARLPCLCIYHKNCIDSWFKVNRSCPEHPSD